ncbi:Cna protein B-type domain protein [Bremerella volcania]|uniref:Cna protein B-type domain protein n=1 Tax=Bremerella volcania TaxID=2527984 RepID=A0A518C708_9BACT|nr:SdrD B-like domain-containing protein [Bremerella volcania]QDU75015.1 Cna protein B-type domain protein [Bremerella volcania]
MKKNKSRQHQVLSKLNKRARRQRTVRRMEPLETRSMLAGDVIAAVHNDYMSHDVNNDGVFDQMDVDTLLLNLQSKQAQQMASRGLLEGEQTLYLDVDNDGRLTTRDLLSAMDALSLEGELADGTFSADVNLRLITSGGNVNETQTGMADINETFQLEVWLEDTSTNPSSIDSAYVDITFNSALLTMDPTTDIVLGPGFVSNLAPDVPNNVTPYGALNSQSDFNNFALANTLRFIGGSSNGAGTIDANLGRLVATLTFTTVAEGTVDFEVVVQDNPQSTDPADLASSFNNTTRSGDMFSDANVNATFFSGAEQGGFPLEISRWTGGTVSLDIMAEPVSGANFDSYEVVEDYQEAQAVPAGDNDPPVVTINGIQYYVLDVLENDMDNVPSAVSAPRDRFNIDSVTQPAQGMVTRELDAQNVQEIVDAGIESHQVLLYQVPTGVGGISESFTYTITDSGLTNNTGTTTATVFVTITEVDQAVLLLEDPYLLEVVAGIESDVIDIMDNVTPGEPSDVPTFIGFFDENGGPLTAGDLQGTFTPVLDGMNNPTGEFTYVSNIPGLTEMITYQVSDGNNQITTGTIIFKTLFDSLLSGVVYFDADNDGVVDDNANTNASPEMRIGGVTIELLDNGGSVVASTITDAYGAYVFAGFDEGTYSVRITDPRFTRKGITSSGSFTLSGNTISGIQVGGGQPGIFTGLNFGYRGRDYQYIGLGDSIASNTEDSIVLAFSKPGGLDSLEWYAVDLGWENLVNVRSDLSFFDTATGASQIAFEVAVDGLDDPVIVVQAFSPSTPGYMVVANGPEGMIVRINGGASAVMTNLAAAVDAAFASL